jgi:antagonist of KipI
MVLKVKNPGLYTTVQDLGRYGHQAEGFSPAGAMDYRAFILANQLLGNDDNAPGLEMTFQGASFEVMKDTVIAAAGAEMKLAIDGKEFSIGVPIPVFKGSLIEFGAAENGSWTYLAVAAGFRVDRVFGSASTHVRSGIGGYCGRTLQVGDVIGTAGTAAAPGPFRITEIEEEEAIRVIPGQQYDRFNAEVREKLFGEGYTLTKDCDRMGYRFDGPELQAEGGHDVLSEPTQLGSIQVPKGGRPIVLLNDRQTAGGYARIGTVARVDIPKLVQKQPGDTVKFEEILVERATALYREEMEKVRTGGYLELNNDFRLHVRPTSGKLKRIMER